MNVTHHHLHAGKYLQKFTVLLELQVGTILHVRTNSAFRKLGKSPKMIDPLQVLLLHDLFIRSIYFGHRFERYCSLTKTFDFSR